MTPFKSLIAHHRNALNAEHARVHVAAETRLRSDAHQLGWTEACRDFHGFRSEVDAYIERVTAEALVEDPLLRQFVFEYMSVDPMYFRSGYQKEKILRALKKVDFIEEERVILRQTILRRVRTKALREFRYLCRLIPKVQTDDFVSELKAAARSTDEYTRRRARVALEYTTD